MGCAAALEVQRIIKEDNLVDNVRDNGEYLDKLLHKQLDGHPYVGNIRGKGFFWSVSLLTLSEKMSMSCKRLETDVYVKLEFVADKKTKEPFPLPAGIAKMVHLTAMNDIGISLYPGTGTKDGVEGDHVLLAPVYTSTRKDIERIVGKVTQAVTQAFEKI